MVSSVPVGSVFRVAVIGAGPAGLAVVGKLLDMDRGPVLWIDEAFESGRLELYRTVPSNTKVKLFVGYSKKFQSFNRAWETGNGEALDVLLGRDQEKGCRLGLAADMVQSLVQGLLACPDFATKLRGVHGRASELRYSSLDATWSIDVNGSGYKAGHLILATGSHPTQLHSTDVNLDRVLHWDHPVTRDDVVGVIGSSHSAMLAIKTLHELDQRPRKVINFYRSPLKFAQYLPDGRIKHDNTGLKGEVAEWVRLHITDAGTGDKAVNLDGFLERIRLSNPEQERRIYSEHRCTKTIPAIGYERNALPRITVDSQQVQVDYNDSAQLTCRNSGLAIPAAQGFGIAFPARVIDVDGSPEAAVGLWKFIAFIDKILS